VRGLDEVPRADQPPVVPVFYAFRAMVGVGFLMLALGLVGVVLWFSGRLLRARLYLRLLVLCFPLGFVATIAGWIVAETGRQPWVVYGLLRTADATSPVLPGAVAGSLAVFVAVYVVLFGAYVHFATALARKGPRPLPARHPEAMRGVRAAEVLPKDA
jgi:cytochrome d ubiquinol oxidase subunit I